MKQGGKNTGKYLGKYTQVTPESFIHQVYYRRTMESNLNKLKTKALSAYEQRISDAPPVSAALLQHLEGMFVPPEVSPGDPAIKEKLLFQHGIERVLKYMRGLHDRQEQDTKARFNREPTCPF